MTSEFEICIQSYSVSARVYYICVHLTGCFLLGCVHNLGFSRFLGCLKACNGNSVLARAYYMCVTGMFSNRICPYSATRKTERKPSLGENDFKYEMYIRSDLVLPPNRICPYYVVFQGLQWCHAYHP